MSRPNPPDETTQRVRQRGRFKCRACGSFGLMQCAHIIPDSKEGTVAVDNLLWMCEGCQRRYEASGLTGFMYDVAVQRMIEIRDTPAIDSLVSGIFDELLANPDIPIRIRSGSLEMITEVVFSEPTDSWQPACLKFFKDNHHLHIEGRLKNENGFVILELKDDHVTFHTKDMWDIIRKARMLRIESKLRNVFFEIKQDKSSGVVYVSGRLYNGGVSYSFSSFGLRTSQGFGISSLTIDTSLANVGVFGLEPSPLPRPYGHINPNVI